MSEKLFKTDEELQEAITNYFEIECCLTKINEDDVIKPPTMSGLALYLGFADRHSLYDYKNNPFHSHTIKRAITEMERFAEETLLTGKQATGAIFWLKNHRWTDKQEIEHTGEIKHNVKWGDIMGGEKPETE